MKSKWKISSQCNDEGQYIYQVYRILDEDEIDHNGNREYQGEVFHTKKEARACADKMNIIEEYMV